jgi:hypothetical protein
MASPGPHPDPSQSPRPPARHTRRGLVGVAVGVGVGIGAVLVFQLRDMIGARTDVGGLAALSQVQAHLRPIDACRIEYNTRKVGVGQDDSTSIRIYACNPGEVFPTPVLYKVPADWPYRHLAFSAERSNAAVRWKIMVDRERVPFDQLEAALGSVAPDIGSTYPALHAALVADRTAEREALDRAEAQRERARQRAKDSYPPR